MKRVVIASNIRKNEYDPESVKKAVYALFDAAFASPSALKKLGTNDITYTITSIRVIKDTRPVRYWLNVFFRVESPDFEYTRKFDTNVPIFNVPTGRQAKDDEFINQDNVDTIVIRLRRNITDPQIKDMIQSNIENFKSAIDKINSEYPEIQLKYDGEDISDSDELVFLYAKLLSLGEHQISRGSTDTVGYLDGDKSLSILSRFKVERFNKNTPIHAEILSVKDYVELLRSYADDCLKYLEVFDKCSKICDTFERSLNNMISAVASKFSVASDDCEVEIRAIFRQSPKVIVHFLGREYEVTDNNGNQILSPSDIVKKATNSLRYQERKAKNPTKPSSGSSYSQELL